MPAISAKLVMELRDSTNLPMMKCKAALEKANGDKEAAIELLRKEGFAAKDKFAGRETPNGAIGLLVMFSGMLFTQSSMPTAIAIMLIGSAIWIGSLYSWLLTPLEDHH